jgi:hypothetical protein
MGMEATSTAREVIDLTQDDDEWRMPEGLEPDEQAQFVEARLQHKLGLAWQIHAHLEKPPTTVEEQNERNAQLLILDTLQNETAACDAFLQELDDDVIMLGTKRRSPTQSPTKNKRRKKSLETVDTGANFECLVCFSMYAPGDMEENPCPKCSHHQIFQLCKRCHKRWKKQCRKDNICINNCTI